MKRLADKIKQKYKKIYNKRLTKLIVNRLVLIICTPLVLLEVVLALVIIVKNWALTKTKELNKDV